MRVVTAPAADVRMATDAHVELVCPDGLHLLLDGVCCCPRCLEVVGSGFCVCDTDPEVIAERAQCAAAFATPPTPSRVHIGAPR